MFDDGDRAEPRARVLVVSDNPITHRTVASGLLGDIDVTYARDLLSAASQLCAFPVAIVDVRMPGPGGQSAIRFLHDRGPEVEIIGLAPHRAGDRPAAAAADGAYDVLQLPLVEGAAIRMVERAARQNRLRREVARLHRELDERRGFSSLIGSSEPMLEAFRLLELAARSDACVLLTGEAGTGKLLAARAIHHEGPRRAGRFVHLPCTALTGPLLEEALFGRRRRRGGGEAERDGALAVAQGGTLYLDTVDALPHPAQTALWAALPDVAPHDGSPGVRLVASSRRDLSDEAHAGRFRRDLLTRLAGLHVHLPPLRDRLGDLPALARHFALASARAIRPAVTGLSREALRALGEYSWPGNVTELEAALKRAVARASGPEIAAEDLPPEIRAGPPTAAAPAPVELGSYREAVERSTTEAAQRYLFALLTRHGGNITAASRHAGMERETLHRLLARFGLRAQDFRSRGGPPPGPMPHDQGTGPPPSRRAG